MEPSIDWTENEAGCYADASLGWDHVCNTLADIIEEYDKNLAKSLREDGQFPGDGSDNDNFQIALDILNEHTEEGMAWIVSNDEGLFLMESEDLG